MSVSIQVAIFSSIIDIELLHYRLFFLENKDSSLIAGAVQQIDFNFGGLQLGWQKPRSTIAISPL